MIATICSSEKRPFRIAPSESGASLQLIDGPKIRGQVTSAHQPSTTMIKARTHWLPRRRAVDYFTLGLFQYPQAHNQRFTVRKDPAGA
jgi:hypothetical protein